jgi:hypothetical protein
MKLTAIQAMSMVSVAAVIAFPATAYAGGPPNPAPSPSPSPAPGQSYQFQNASQNISCNLGPGSVVCEISNRNYTPPTPPPACAQHSAWGDRAYIDDGGPVQLDCHNDTIHVQGEQVVNNGQTLSSGPFSCTADAASVKCTNSSSGHFFFLSPNTFQEG